MSLSKLLKRNDLTLKYKYDVIKEAEKNPGIGIRRLAEMFKCGETQISCILKKKAEIVSLYHENASLDLCHTRKRSRPLKFSDVNDALFDWYQLACSKNIYPNGSLLKEKAKQIAEHMGIDFKASNGWLDKWKKKHHIKQLVICGESGDVATVESWKERLSEICKNYI